MKLIRGFFQGLGLSRLELLDARFGEVHQGRQLLATKGCALGGALNFEQMQLLIHHHVQIHLGAAVFAVVQIQQADAGTRTASITGAWAALALGLRRLEQRGVLEHSPLIGQVAAVSVGLVDGAALLDLDYSEDSRAEVDLNVVMNQQLHLLEIQGTAEGAPFSRQQLSSLVDLAETGIQQLQATQTKALEEAPN